MCGDSTRLWNSQVTSLVSRAFSQYAISLVHVCLLSSTRLCSPFRKTLPLLSTCQNPTVRIPLRPSFPQEWLAIPVHLNFPLALTATTCLEKKHFLNLYQIPNTFFRTESANYSPQATTGFCKQSFARTQPYPHATMAELSR